MALILKDRVKETSSSSGTGSVTLGGAFPGFQTFDAVVATGSTVYYTIHNLTAGVDDEFEVGVGTFTSPTTLSRDTVFSSSAGGTSKVNFTAGADGLEVFITQPAEEAIYLNQATGKVEVGGNGTNTVSFTNINTTNLTANTVTLTAGTISTTPNVAADIANKEYVDNLVASGTHFHEPVRVESPINLTATYNNGTDGVGATLTNSGTQAALVIDGITMVVADRVLVYEQTNQTQNGVYVVTDVGSGSTNWILTRSDDANTFGLTSPNTLGEGSTFFVREGDTGAGETYTCNTVGTIIFGTTNITFVQISAAQIYSAGTGLSLTNTTFSIANTAVTAATYGTAGEVAQFTVNNQGQITNAANVSINASSITLGTLANDRTTAASANGTNTIVLRDANGSFAGNVITATTSNATTFNGTTGSFGSVSGNGVALTAINASNVTSGTLDNARTTGNTANSASTLVLRDANGSFGANIITATFNGNAATLSAINASNISSGTIANARTTAASANGASTIVLRDSGGSFDANLVNAVALSGNAATVTGINASNIASGTIANARTTAATANGASTIVLRGASGEFAAGAITGTSFSGNGSAITAINASSISSGTLDNARTTAASANGASTIVVRDVNGSFSGNVITGTTGTFTNISGNGISLTAINASNVTSGTLDNARTTAASANGASTIVARDSNGSFTANVVTATNFSGGGASITAINASSISSGTVATARLGSGTANASTFLRGDQTYAAVPSPNNGTLTMGVSGTGLSGSATFTADQAGGSTFTVASNASSANGASTIVARDASGNFTSNVITATLTGTASNATVLQTARTINGTSFDGSANITITANTTNTLTLGTGLTGTSFNGSGAVTATVSYGTTAGTACQGNDSRLSDSRQATNTNTQLASLGVGTAASGTGGEIRATNNVTAFFSDERLKTKTGNIENALDKVCQIETLLYHANETAVALGYDASIQEVGVTAQSVQKVQPEIVVPAPIDDKYLTVRYEKLVPLLIEAIKELKAEVDALKGK
jgi:hypothetical protein